MIIIVKFIKHKRSKIVIGFMLAALIVTSTIFVGFKRKEITVLVDGTSIKLVTYKQTFDSALKSANINIAVKDKIDKALNSKIVNKDIITINRAVNLKVFVDNKELLISSAEKDIALMLSTEKIALSPNDKVSPIKETKLTNGMDIVITRVKTETVLEKKSIDFKTVIKDDKKAFKSQSKVIQEGSKGEKTITISVTYENGKEVTRIPVKETIVKQPQSKIIAQGTLSPITISRGQSSNDSKSKVIAKAPASSGKTFTVKATAYWADISTNAYTSSGKKAVRNPNGISTIAVDPKVIPLGTKLYVEGYGYAVAADTGSSVKGNYIDVFFNTGGECRNWGVKYLKVQILD
jgi:uncharacterized protein YabE (DUF348 family)